MIFCASTGRKCSGICRKQNLNRERKFLKVCPAAYGGIEEHTRQKKYLIKRDFKWH